jgi:hypothetical protein
MTTPKLREGMRTEILKYILEKASSQLSLSELTRAAIINKFKSEQFDDDNIDELIDELIDDDKAVHSHELKLDVIIPYDKATNFTKEYAPYITKGKTSIIVISLIITILMMSYFGITSNQSTMTSNISSVNTNVSTINSKDETPPNYGVMYLLGLVINVLVYSFIDGFYEKNLRHLQIEINLKRKINLVFISSSLSMILCVLLIYSYTFLNHKDFTVDLFAIGVGAGATLAAAFIFIFSKDFHV